MNLHHEQLLAEWLLDGLQIYSEIHWPHVHTTSIKPADGGWTVRLEWNEDYIATVSTLGPREAAEVACTLWLRKFAPTAPEESRA